MSKPTSPFKFLDAYGQEDADIFFGREAETQALYDALSGVKHLLVYGPSGAGKTSLIECGLRNQFSDADWYALTIRRGKSMAASVFAEINQALQQKIELHPATGLPVDTSIGFGQAIEDLFAERYQPVYLLFDQFEELLISGQEAEKQDFFTRLHDLIRYKVPCRVMLIMREEFIGHLSEFEPLCPSIFQHRFRREKMRRSAVQDVIFNILEAPRYQSRFRVDDSEKLAASILKKLPDRQQEIELTHVQVFLSEIWDRASETGENDRPPLLHRGLLRSDDNLETVLDSFLKKQLSELKSTHGDEAPLELLACMISERYTKLQLGVLELQHDLQKTGVPLQTPLIDLLQDLESRRIVRQLKSGEVVQFEISHDVLALVVGKNKTTEMKLREDAARLYAMYEKGNSPLSREALDELRFYQHYKPYPGKLAERVRGSEQHWAKKDREALELAQRQAEEERVLKEQAQVNERRARQRTGLAAIVSVIALGLALFAGWSYIDANSARKAADKSAKLAAQKTEEAEKALKARIELEIKKYLTAASRMETSGDFDLAKKILDEALKLDSTNQEVKQRLNKLQ